MEELRKIDSLQLYRFWKVLALSLAVIIAMFTLSRIFPPVLSPIFSLLCAGVIYHIMMTNRTRPGVCLIVPYVVFVSLIIYSFVTIIANILEAWGVIALPNELLFYRGVYMPALPYLPIAAITFSVIGFRKKHLRMCRDCKITYADNINHSRIGSIFNRESHFQLKNMIAMMTLLSVVVWVYFLFFYVDIAQNARDWYIFTWVIIIVFVLDEVYFMMRYYNLYLDLKENNEIITPEEIEDMTAKTYLRFYVIAGNNVYVDMDTVDEASKYGKVIDTPFFTKRNVNGIAQSDVYRIIKEMTGRDGELRFFYGRKTSIKGHSLLRYFYFLDGTPEEIGTLSTAGEWCDYEKIKRIYSTDPGRLATISIIDTTRLSTIILTHKIYDDNGIRRSGIKHYMPSFNLLDVHDTKLDYQDEKWIRISIFNSDTSMFRIKRWWRKLVGRSGSDANTWII